MTKSHGHPGSFIALEGGEGCGKTTQIGLLTEGLKRLGLDVVRTREPGGSPGAEQIRKLLVTGAGDRWSGKAEVLLFNAARVDHLEKTILPALERGAIVVCDRFVGSSISYQSVARGVPRELIKAVHRLFCDDIHPDLTLILDIPPEVGLARAKARAAAQISAGAGGGSGRGPGSSATAAEDRFEGFDLAFHQKLRQAFLDQAAEDPARHAVIDATQDVDAVAARIADAAGRLLRRS